MKQFISKYPWLFVWGFYFLLTVAFTFPLVQSFGTEIPEGGGDVFQGLSNINTQIAGAQAVGGWQGLVFLAKHAGTYSFFSLFGWLFGKTVGYNLVFFLTYFLSAVGAYCLAWHFTRHRVASLFAGVIFAFSPFHYYQSISIHMGTMQQQWLPFLVLFFVRFLEKRRWQDYVGFMLFFVLTALAEHQMLAFAILFLALYFVIRVWRDRSILRDRRLWIYIGGSVLVLALLVFFVFGDLLRVALSSNNFLDAGIGAADKYSMPLLAPLAPPDFHAFWPGVNAVIGDFFLAGSGTRVAYFLGFSLVILVAWFWCVLWRKRSEVGKKKRTEEWDIRLWSILFVVFWILALGPMLDIFSVKVPLPYYIIYTFVPFYENIRVTGRLFLIAVLAFSVVVAYAVRYLDQRSVTAQPGSRKCDRHIIAVVGIIALLEFLPAPLRTMPLEHSPFYDRIAAEPGDFKLIEIPGSTSYEFASYKLMTSTIHGKVSLDGMSLARHIQGQFDMQNNTPVIKQLLFSIPKGKDSVATPPEDAFASTYFDQATDILDYYGVRYITITKRYTAPQTFVNEEKFIRTYVCTDDRYEDGFLVVYRVCTRTPESAFLAFNTNNGTWSLSSKDKTTGVVSRAMGDGAVLEVHNLATGSRVARLSFDLTLTSSAIRTVSLRDGSGRALFEQTLNLSSSRPVSVTVDATVPVGTSNLTFSVRDASGQPVDVTGKKNQGDAPLISGVGIDVAR